MQSSPELPPRYKDINIEDPEEARDFIRRQIEEEHELPIVTVPLKYIEAARSGIKPHTTWIYDSIIAGTLGRTPYHDELAGERAAFRVKVPADQIEPRFTGPDKRFHGVIAFKSSIPPEALEEIS